ncbi:MAG TPA: hypothetical protein VIU14_16780 [Mesorhizobium sp.]
MRIICLALTACILASPAWADDDNEKAEQARIGNAIDVAFGATVVSDYLDGGETRSGGKPSFQVYAEPTYGMLYVGVRFATVDMRADDDDDGGEDEEELPAAEDEEDGPASKLETTLYAGIRPQLGPVELDLGVEHLIYEGLSSIDDTTLHAEAEYEFNDRLSFEGEVEYSLREENWQIEAATELGIFEKAVLYAAVGHEFGGEEESVNYWTAGARYDFNDVLSASAGYYGADNGLSKAVAALTVKTSYNRLNGAPAAADDD